MTRVTGFEAAAATPRALIDGVAPDVWRQGDVLSGVFYGWLNQNHATTVQYKVGKGKVVFTTLDATAYGKDLFVTHLRASAGGVRAERKCAPASELARR